MATRAQIRLRERDGALIAAIGHKLMDADVCATLRKSVLATLGQRNLPVVLDLCKVSLLPSIAVGALVGLHKELATRGSRLVLACLTEPIRKMLEIARLDEVLLHADTVQLGLVLATRPPGAPGGEWAAVAPSASGSRESSGSRMTPIGRRCRGASHE